MVEVKVGKEKQKKLRMVVYRIGGKEYIGFKRVVYGGYNTPKEKREYYLEGMPGSPVGTRKEIKEVMKEFYKGYAGVLLIDNGKGIDVKEFILTEDL